MNKISLRQSIIAGVIGGLIYSILSFGTYYTSMKSFAGFSFAFSLIPVVLVIILILGFKLRKKLGGYVSFKEVLQYALVAYLIYEIIVAIITYILFIVIDPLLTQKLYDTSIHTSVDFMKNMGATQAQIDETIAKARKNSPETGVGTIVKGIAWSLIWDFVKSLLIAWIVKKDRPAELDFNPKPLI